MIETMTDIDLTNEYWDCECEKNYIHLISQNSCPICKAEERDQPDSRVSEVLKYGFTIFGEETVITTAKKLALNWMQKNVNVKQWLEDQWTSLSDEFDLNVYIDDDGKKRATVFLVVDGETDLEKNIEVL